ncbi:MAG: hypothetical protein AB7P49_11890, partial [Bdellovibrionales bacterium]
MRLPQELSTFRQYRNREYSASRPLSPSTPTTCWYSLPDGKLVGQTLLNHAMAEKCRRIAATWNARSPL